MALFQPSTAEELAACRYAVAGVEAQIAGLTAAGKRVHVIWDMDHVLVSGRSDDAFAVLGHNVDKYFVYEERLITTPLENGPWARLAHRCGELHQSQDIVTARSSLLAMRVHFWLIRNKRPVPTRWQLFVGHQSKADSYRIILESFAKDPDVHVFMVDDAKKHVAAFEEVAARLGMADRCHGVLAPQVRSYDASEVIREVEAVLSAEGERPQVLAVTPRVPGTYGRYVIVTPDPHKAVCEMFWKLSHGAEVKAVVDLHRDWLTEWAQETLPRDKTPDDDYLYGLYQLISG